jgi:hypothetical protein
MLSFGKEPGRDSTQGAIPTGSGTGHGGPGTSLEPFKGVTSNR